MARLAIIRRDRCNPQRCSRECYASCPRNRMGEECIKEGVDKKPIIDEELCVGCGICVHKCPFNAIDIVKLPEESKARPIQRFLPNGFSLYNLPIPKFGKVIGILGKNGIGKTTSIKILAGLLKPNFGKEKQANYDDLINFFKGTEAQNYFEKLKNKKIEVAYKPQKVDEIPKQVKGKVRNLLKKVDEKNQLEKISKELGIEKILDHDIKNISGGELQKVAIAATVLRKANVFYFDEVSAYLDIKERLKIAKFIRSLANEDTAVLVVEHDLIVLDYMADLTHLMYGKPACYGIVSGVKAAKTGINSYLSGYLKEENIRFRDKEIKFLIRKALKEKLSTTLTKWPEMEKKLNSFELKVNEGEIDKKEIVGVLGANAIGKTTFVKILAGILKPDKGKIDLNVKVAYKPQYLQADSTEMVSKVLAKAIEKYKVDLIKGLELEDLLIKKISELSGGELQRVAIALCLSQNADLMLLDEPSAFLDVEQRLAVSRAIKEIIEKRGISVLVVDHDLLFLDYLSNRLLVFKGEAAIKGIALSPLNMEEGMNKLLTDLNISLRRDYETGRPRINKPGSQMDRKQKKEGKLYYS